MSSRVPLDFTSFCQPKVPPLVWKTFHHQGSPLQIGRFFLTKGPSLGLDDFSSTRVPLWFPCFSSPKDSPLVLKILRHWVSEVFVNQRSPHGFGRFMPLKCPPLFFTGIFHPKISSSNWKIFVTKGLYLCLDYFSSPRVPPWVSRFLVTRGFPLGASGSNEAIKSKEEFQECFKGDLIVKFQRDPKNLIHQSKSDLPEVIRMWDYKKTQIYSIVNHYYSLVGLVLPSLFY